MPTAGDHPPPRAAKTQTDVVPWAVAGVALLALVAMLAGRGMSRERDPQPIARPASAAPARAIDISQLTPEEQADRLYNRVMSLAGQGKLDSVGFFATMAIQAYANLAPLNNDQHYDVGRVAEVAGALPLAKAHADSILAREPTHLLGLILAARVAELESNATAQRAYERQLLAAEPAELRKRLPEYERHQEEIAAAIAAARRRAR